MSEAAPSPPQAAVGQHSDHGPLRRTTAPGPRRVRGPRAGYGFVAPAVVFFAAFFVLPVVYAIYLSLRGAKLTGGGALGIRRETWVGLSNYRDSLTDPELLASLGRMLVIGAVAVPVTLGAALLFALLLDVPRVRATRFSRTAIFMPYAVPGVVASLLWGFLYLPSTTPFAFTGISFLDAPALFGSVANIAVWSGVGFNMIILYTALQSVPRDVYEAARLDGCGEWQIAWRIKIPLVVPALALTGLFSLIGALQIYGEPQTLRPLTSSISSTWVPLMKVYRDAFATDDINGAAATSVVLALGSLLLSLLVLRLAQRRTRSSS